MTITSNCTYQNCACVSKSGTAIIVINSFLVKHNSKHSCDSAIYHNLSREIIDEFCTFEHSYNTTEMPSVLDRGPLILCSPQKRLTCTYVSDMACFVPSHDYVIVNRSIL